MIRFLEKETSLHREEMHYVAKAIRSMYVKKDETLYVQFQPLSTIKHIIIHYRNAKIEGDVIKFTKSGCILTNWKITNINF